MEVTVVDTADLPPNTVLSFHTRSGRRHVPLEKDGRVLFSAAESGPVRVDLMSLVGSHTFGLAPGTQIYDVPIAKGVGGAGAVHLQCRICDPGAGGREKQGDGPAVPQRKLQTALMMRSYLDNHDVLRQMQELLQEMVVQRPDDPVEYMIRKLDEISQESQGIEIDPEVCPIVVRDAPTKPAGAPLTEPAKEPEKAEAPATQRTTAESDRDSDSEAETDDGGMPELQPAPIASSSRRGSVSSEAHGKYNQRSSYVPVVIPKTDEQKDRVLAVLEKCWMFNGLAAADKRTVVDSMQERSLEAGTRLIQQGNLGEAMWVLEEGSLQCYKTIKGAEKLVKTVNKHDVVGELALLYGEPRAASVIAAEECIVWELGRDTFRAICFNCANSTEYSGYTPPAQRNSRRTAVSAEAGFEDVDTWTPPVHQKTPEERSQLSQIIKTSQDSKLHMLFGFVNDETFEQILDAMSKKCIAAGAKVIQMGEEGDFFYIVKSGLFDIVVKKGDVMKKVFEAAVGFAFGELALLYNAPRTATVTATVPSEVWCLDRVAFRNLVVRSSETQFRQCVEFISGIPLFQDLHSHERADLAEVFEEETFKDGEAIVEQNEIDDKMFILRSGKAVACIQGDEGEVEVMHYSRGAYFGEIALLLGEPRRATVYAVGHTACLYISRDTFRRMLGPIEDILKRNADTYASYRDVIAQVADSAEGNEDAAGDDDADENDQEGGAIAETSKFKRRIRKNPNMPHDEAAVAPTRPRLSEKLSEEAVGRVIQRIAVPPPEGMPEMSLADRLALDFQMPARVEPTPSFVSDGARLRFHAGLLAGQKFKDDQILCFSGQIGPDTSTDVDVFTWTCPTVLDGSTEISVLCQKGQKTGDPTPNQDNYFVRQYETFAMYGVLDGHGPFGHLISFRLSQSLPHYIGKRRQSVEQEGWGDCLKAAFLEAQEELLIFAAEHDVNLLVSGACASVVVLEEQTVHIAFVGDCRVVLGSWHRHNSHMIFCSQDHKPDLPGERARLEGAGSEVRSPDSASPARVYLRGRNNIPGLAVSRSFGDTACAGILQEPEYHHFVMQPTDEWFCMLASDGMWEFMEGQEMCDIGAKKLRLKGARETLRFLVDRSRKRWEYCCEAYCDDITGVLVKWNSKCKGIPKGSNTLAVKRGTLDGEAYVQTN